MLDAISDIGGLHENGTFACSTPGAGERDRYRDRDRAHHPGGRSSGEHRDVLVAYTFPRIEFH
jgi:hypothetical protein